QRHRVLPGGSWSTGLRAILVPLTVSVVCPPLRPPVLPRTKTVPTAASALRIMRRQLPRSSPRRRAAARKLPVCWLSLSRRATRSSEYRKSGGFEDEGLSRRERGETIDHRCSEPLIILVAGPSPRSSTS